MLWEKENEDTKVFDLDNWKNEENSNKKQQQVEAWYGIIGFLARKTK